MTIKHVALSLAFAFGLAGAASAQEGPKLYVFTSGSLGGSQRPRCKWVGKAISTGPP
jgi:hypothetical protein